MKIRSNNTKNGVLTRRIMRRIYVVAAIRAVLNPIFLKALLVAVFFFRSMEYVSYGNVLANAPSLFEFENNVRFFSGALAHTSSVTLFLYTGIGVMIAWISFDFARHKTHAWF